MSRKLIDPKMLLEDLGEEPYIWTDTDAEIQEHSDWLRFKKMIEQQPTVDAVEVVHGQWEAEYEYEDFQYATCSVCGKRSEYMTKFCGNCGAKMDGDRNG